MNLFLWLLRTVSPVADAPEILRGHVEPATLPLPDDLNYDVGPACRKAQVVAGGTVTFTCNVAAQPSADLTWTMPSGLELRAGEAAGNLTVDENGILRVSNAGASGGKYQCLARNYAGMDVEYCNLTVISEIWPHCFVPFRQLLIFLCVYRSSGRHYQCCYDR